MRRSSDGGVRVTPTRSLKIDDRRIETHFAIPDQPWDAEELVICS
jgi:hypothetical protein